MYTIRVSKCDKLKLRAELALAKTHENNKAKNIAELILSALKYYNDNYISPIKPSGGGQPLKPTVPTFKEG